MKIEYNEEFYGAKGECTRCGCRVTLDNSDRSSIKWSYSGNGMWMITCPDCKYSIECGFDVFRQVWSR